MSLPSSWASVPDWIRMAALKLNPIINGYPFMQLDADPASVDVGFTYFNTGTGKVRTWTGSAWANHY